MHIPVLLKEAIEILNPKPGEFFIDGTVGSGGHSAAILEKIGENGKLLAVDWDERNIEKLAKIKKSRNWENIILVRGNYAGLPEILKENSLPKADGLIVDLGFSSEQIESGGRGFSFMRDEKLDMRYYPDEDVLTAAEVVNSFNEKDLADIFWKYGEERYSRQIAKKIIEERRKKRILTTFELTEIIKRAVSKSPPRKKSKIFLRGYERGRIHLSHKFMWGIHPATRVFQALRIYVNSELDNLEKILDNLSLILNNKGRAAIISFHSLEDRLVKNYFRQMVKDGKAEILTKKPITATEEEIKSNPRSRSAKLRAVVLRK